VERLLVTGIDHPLGSNLALALVERFQVLDCTANTLSSRANLPPRTMPRTTARTSKSWYRIGDRNGSSIAGLSRPSWDRADSEQLAEQEPKAAAQWAKLAGELSARFDGNLQRRDVLWTANVSRGTSPTHNPSPRAAQVRAMERALDHSGALVNGRHAYGWSPVPDHACFAERAYESLVSGRPIEADGRRHATPILATDLAELLVRAYEKRIDGLHHLSGAERTSPFRFVSQLATACGLPAPSEPTRPG